MTNPLDNLPANLPNVARAKLPEAYQGARKALAVCVRVDECKRWKDKAMALASYAKQSQDDELLLMSRRIQARAVRRCGILLGELERSQLGGRPNKKNGADTQPVSIRGAAEKAGLSKAQQKDARSVAAIPEAKFEKLIESNEPPTVTQLAKQGRKPRQLVELGERTPDQFKAATALIGMLDNFMRLSKDVNLQKAIKGLSTAERRRVVLLATKSRQWIAKLEKTLMSDQSLQ